jgi:hypothetical protein
MARGRPSRIPGEPARQRVEVRFTLGELRTLRALARANGASVADTLRLAVLESAAEAGESPVIQGRRVLDRIVAGSNSRRGARSRDEKQS